MSNSRQFINTQADFRALRLRRAKSLLWQQLECVLPKLGALYSNIELELGPRGGLRSFTTHAKQRIELYTDASCGSKGNLWKAVAFRRYADGHEARIWREIATINDQTIEWATPAEAFAVCMGLEWISKSLDRGVILRDEPIELYVDNSAIYWKLVKDLPFGEFSELYERMIGLCRPLRDSGRLQIFVCTHFTNRAD